MKFLQEIERVQSRVEDGYEVTLKDDFYQRCGQKLASLREEREKLRKESDDPFNDDEIQHITYELKTIEEKVEEIYERRVGEIMKLASLAGMGYEQSVDTEHLTPEEMALYNNAKENISETNESLPDTLSDILNQE